MSIEDYNQGDNKPKKKKPIGRPFCDYEKVIECMKKGGADNLLLYQLQTSLVRNGGFVDMDAVRAFGRKIEDSVKTGN